MCPSARGVSQGVGCDRCVWRPGSAVREAFRPQASPVRSCCCRPLLCLHSSALATHLCSIGTSGTVAHSPSAGRGLCYTGVGRQDLGGAWSIPTTLALNELGSDREMRSHEFQRVKGQGSHTSLSFSFPECQGHSLLPLRPPVGSWGWRLGHEAPCGGST